MVLEFAGGMIDTDVTICVAVWCRCGLGLAMALVFVWGARRCAYEFVGGKGWHITSGKASMPIVLKGPASHNSRTSGEVAILAFHF